MDAWIVDYFGGFKEKSRDRAWMLGSSVNCLNFEKEVSKVLRRDQETVSL